KSRIGELEFFTKMQTRAFNDNNSCPYCKEYVHDCGCEFEERADELKKLLGENKEE
ncbi:unnamed protein product, partial [marine sediment metagenome]